MKKIQILEATKNIKEWLDVKYHHLLNTDIFNIQTNFNIKNCINCKTPYDNMQCLDNYYKNVDYYKKNISLANTVKIPYIGSHSNEDIDFILLEYIKYTKNIVPILLWPTIAYKNFFNDSKTYCPDFP